ncbi:chorion protein ERB.1 precursor [Bombyx mori]|uniref:Chorion early B n=1 Tax=Bombyx mori TaxID=7091 RepID=A0A0K2S2Z1_BOMMO|nr:chorion protein ERB.1 precursor [Bombyx mori]BAS21476.1 chorion early B [Bombyx mori]
MAFRDIVVLASALFVQSALSQCVGRAGPGLGGYRGGWDGFGYDGLGYDGAGYEWNGRLGCGGLGDDIAAASALGASHGGTLAVVTSSAAPTGLGIASENSYEGGVGICGNLPFLSTASIAGELRTGGTGGIDYGCGNGAVGITVESVISPAINYAPAGAPLGRSFNRGCGCGAANPY